MIPDELPNTIKILRGGNSGPMEKGVVPSDVGIGFDQGPGFILIDEIDFDFRKGFLQQDDKGLSDHGIPDIDVGNDQDGAGAVDLPESPGFVPSQQPMDGSP
jgi:hypothetical protein